MAWQGLALEAKSLACERGGKLIFKDLSFLVRSGEVVELRGPNGAGKSTLLRLLAGLNKALSGSLTLTKSRHPDESRDHSQAEKDSGFRRNDDFHGEQSHYIGHHEAVKPALTVRENLEFWAGFQGGIADLASLKLQHLADDEARLLSEGQRRRLSLSRLVSVKRPIWLLDEPTVGLDQTALADLRSVIKCHLAEDGLVIAATHADLGLSKTRVLKLEAPS